MAVVQKQWEADVIQRVNERHRKANEATAQLMAERQAERQEKNLKERKAFLERREREKQREAEEIKKRELRFFQRQSTRNRRRAQIEEAQAEDIKHRAVMQEALRRKVGMCNRIL